MTRAVHWLVALVVIGMLAAGLYAGSLDVSTTEGDLQYFWVIDIHKSFGIIVIVAMIFRVLWRLGETTPSLPGDLPRWEALFARAIQLLFYLALILIPVTGFLWATAYGEPLRFFGLKLPSLIHVRGDNATLAHRAHVIAAFVLIGVLALHVAGALKNHFVGHNDVLRKMLGIASRVP